jgi:4-hydroxybenzoate polyprenyltransferase
MKIQAIINTYVRLLRPHQWLKNLLLLFPPFFAGKILDPSVVATIVPSLLSFSLAASCGYILNDMKDREFDRRHVHKQHRPFARGDVSILVGSILAVLIYIAAMILSGAVSMYFEGYLIIYLFLSFFYTMYFKNIVIMDIFFISFGFLIRVLAGGEAFQVTVSGWLFLTVFVVSLLLATGKRLGEHTSLGADAFKQRTILIQYPPAFLEGMLWFSAAAVLVTYSIYALEHRNAFYYTVPVVAFGLLRYIFIVKQGKGDPTEVLLTDGQIISVGIIWAVMIGVIIYK